MVRRLAHPGRGVLRVLLLVASGLGSSLPEGAAGAEPEVSLRARRLFEEGVELTKQQRWEDALARFVESRALVERPSTVFNIGATLLKMGRRHDAIESFQAYLGISDPSDQD